MGARPVPVSRHEDQAAPRMVGVPSEEVVVCVWRRAGFPCAVRVDTPLPSRVQLCREASVQFACEGAVIWLVSIKYVRMVPTWRGCERKTITQRCPRSAKSRVLIFSGLPMSWTRCPSEDVCCHMRCSMPIHRWRTIEEVVASKGCTMRKSPPRAVAVPRSIQNVRHGGSPRGGPWET